MEQDNIIAKECSHCHRTLPVTEFYKKKGTSDGLQYYCKQCQIEFNNAYKCKKKAFGGGIPNSHASRHVSLWRNLKPAAILEN